MIVDAANFGKGERGKKQRKQPPIDAGAEVIFGFRSVHDQVFRDG
jgi:hypothetical protein